MSLEYQIKVSEQLESIRARLGSMQSEAESVLRRAIRQTGNAVRKRMLEEARARYAETDPRLSPRPACAPPCPRTCWPKTP